MFHKAWKIGKISPIPKSDNPSSNNDYRPITVLPILSKVYDWLVSIQIVTFIETNHIYSQTMSGFRSNHSTHTALIKMKDDLVKAMR